MAYDKKQWFSGETITASKLNRIENGIDELDKSTTNLANNLNSETQTRTSEIDTLTSNLNSEIQTRTSEANTLKSRVDQIIAPTGETPNPSEITDARVGADGKTYDSLGNAIRGQVTDLKKFKPVNILTLGAVNDGSTDCSNIINQYTELYDLYFPSGKYLISKPVTIKKSIVGAGKVRGYKVSDSTWFIDGINADSSGTYMFNIIKDNNDSSVSISDINISLSGLTGGIKYTGAEWFYSRINNVNIIDVASVGILLTGVAQSRGMFMDDISISGALGYTASIGIKNESIPDCRFSNIEVMKCQIGIWQYGGILYGSNLHIYCGPREEVDNGSWWANTVGILFYNKTRAFFSNLYIDTALYQMRARGSCSIHVNGYVYWEDSTVSSVDTDAGRVVHLPIDEDKGRVVAKIENGYILITSHLGSINHSVNSAMDVIYENVSFAYKDTLIGSTIDRTYVNYDRIMYGFYITSDTINKYHEIIKMEMSHSGYVSMLVFDNKGNKSTLNIEINYSNTGNTLKCSASQTYNNTLLKLYLEKETMEDGRAFMKVFLCPETTGTYYVQDINIAGGIVLVDYSRRFNKNGTSYYALRSVISSDEATVDESSFPKSVSGFAENKLYRIKPAEQQSSALMDLGLTQSASFYDILKAMKDGSQLQISGAYITDARNTSDEYFIWKSSGNNVIHKSLIVCNGTTISGSASDSLIYWGQLDYSAHTVTWRKMTF